MLRASAATPSAVHGRDEGEDDQEGRQEHGLHATILLLQERSTTAHWSICISPCQTADSDSMVRDTVAYYNADPLLGLSSDRRALLLIVPLI